MPATLVASLAALACAFLVTRAFVRGAGPALMDHPNERSLHETPVRRTGGLAIVAGIVIGHGLLVILGAAPDLLLPFALCAGIVFAVSVADDVRHVPALARLAAHVVAAGGLFAAGTGLAAFELPALTLELPPALAAVLSVLFVAWAINLYNFMDGMDGFAGGMGVIGFATLGILCARAGALDLAASSAVVAAGCAGFLAWNLPPARIFMGDAGASVLGFLVALVALEAERRALFPLWIPVLVFSPFIVDATVTLLRRALAVERVWAAHRTHFYQRLVRLGWGHRRTMIAEYALMLACSASALFATEQAAPVQGGILVAWVMAYTALMVGVTVLERRGGVR